MPNMPFGRAVEVAASIGAVHVSFDPDAMEELGVSFRDPVDIQAADATVATLLKKIAATRNMAPVIRNGQVLLTSTDAYREELRTDRYNVSDLASGDAKAVAELATLVERFVEPESWQSTGGPGTMQVLPDVLQITQSGHVHYQIVVFFEKLRDARKLPTRSGWDPNKFSLETRTARATPLLGRVMSLSIAATPLREVLKQFNQPPGTDILIDRPVLAAAGISENVNAKLRSENLPQGIVLRQLLEPLGLAWRAVDAHTLQVTTKAAVAARLELEFHPVGKRLAGKPPTDLIAQAKKAVPDAVWGEAAGEGKIYFDPPSQCLIVLQTQPVQAAVEAFLTK